MAYEEFVSTAERLRREGREEGRKEGHREGHKEGHREGHKEGHREGHKEGLEEGRRALLCSQLALRFGKLSPAVRKRVERADREALERWAERVLSATSLVVFAEPAGSRHR